MMNLDIKIPTLRTSIAFSFKPYVDDLNLKVMVISGRCGYFG